MQGGVAIWLPKQAASDEWMYGQAEYIFCSLFLGFYWEVEKKL